jgi:hypothetical protein
MKPSPLLALFVKRYASLLHVLALLIKRYVMTFGKLKGILIYFVSF